MSPVIIQNIVKFGWICLYSTVLGGGGGPSLESRRPTPGLNDNLEISLIFQLPVVSLYVGLAVQREEKKS